MQSPPPFPLQPPYFFFVFIAMWVSISALLSYMGGWYGLSKVYPDRAARDGETFRFASMSLGKGLFPVNYGSCLSVRVGVFGVRLATFFPFRLFHAPLFIPWSAVSACRPEKFLVFKQTAVYLTSPDTRLRFNGRVGSAIQRQYESLGQAEQALAADARKNARGPGIGVRPGN